MLSYLYWIFGKWIKKNLQLFILENSIDESLLQGFGWVEFPTRECQLSCETIVANDFLKPLQSSHVSSHTQIYFFYLKPGICAAVSYIRGTYHVNSTANACAMNRRNYWFWTLSITPFQTWRNFANFYESNAIQITLSTEEIEFWYVLMSFNTTLHFRAISSCSDISWDNFILSCKSNPVKWKSNFSLSNFKKFTKKTLTCAKRLSSPW